VVELLRARSLFANVNRRVGVYNVGVRLVIPDGREVIWDNDGAAGLEAMVLRDGDLVGYVPQVPDSDDLDAKQIAHLIAETDYDAPPAPSTPSNPTSGRSRSARSGTPKPAADRPVPATPVSQPPAAPATPEAPPASKPAAKSRWSDLLRRRTD
jgi:septal ring-binding cell division protein DamX